MMIKLTSSPEENDSRVGNKGNGVEYSNGQLLKKERQKERKREERLKGGKELPRLRDPYLLVRLFSYFFCSPPHPPRILLDCFWKTESLTVLFFLSRRSFSFLPHFQSSFSSGYVFSSHTRMPLISLAPPRTGSKKLGLGKLYLPG